MTDTSVRVKKTSLCQTKLSITDRQRMVENKRQICLNVSHDGKICQSAVNVFNTL